MSQPLNHIAVATHGTVLRCVADSSRSLRRRQDLLACKVVSPRPRLVPAVMLVFGWVAFSITASLLAGCGPFLWGPLAGAVAGSGGEHGDNDAISQTVTQPVGPEGATVHAPGGASAEIPPGALAGEVEITLSPGPDITPNVGTVPVGPSFHVDAKGAAFSKPVTLRLPYNPAALPAGTDPEDIVILVLSDDRGSVEQHVPTSIDPDGFLTLEVTTFSSFQPAVGTFADGVLSKVSVDRTAGVVADGVDFVEVTVSLRDRLDRPVVGCRIHLDVSGSDNTRLPPMRASGADGIVQAKLASTRAERKTITVIAHRGSVHEVTLTTKKTVTFTHGRSVHLAFVTQPATTTVGVSIVPAVSVELLDAFGNRTGAATNTVSLVLAVNSRNAVLLGTTSRVPTDGVSVFSDLRIDKVGTGYLLEASAAGFASVATSTSFDIVNEPPTLDNPGPQSGYEDVSGVVVLTGISPGTPADEAGQTVTLLVDSNNPGLFDSLAVGPVTLNGTSTITYATKPDLSGMATITVTSDDHQSANNTAQVSFELEIRPVNDRPTTSGLAHVGVNEDATNAAVPLRSAFGDTEDSPAALDYSVLTNSNQALVQASVDPTTDIFVLDFAPDAHGTATLTIQARDHGDGSDTTRKTVETILTVAVIAVNDRPTSTGITDLPVDEDTSDLMIPLRVAFYDVEDGAEGLTYEVTGNTNTGLVTTFVDLDTDLLTLSFGANMHGTTDITVRATDHGDSTDTTQKSVETTFTVTVVAVNDGPTSTRIPDVTVAENAPDVVIPLRAAFYDAEDGAEGLTYQVTGNTNTGLVATSVNPDIDLLRLSFVANMHGTADITVRATDHGDSTDTTQKSVAATFTVTLTPAPPNAPGNLAASAISATQTGLTWTDNSDNETGFAVSRSLTGSGQWEQVATVGLNVTAFTDTTVVQGTAYSYVVRAFGTGGTSSASNVVEVTIPLDSAPNAPTGLTLVHAATDSVTLSWTDLSDDEEGFTVQRSLAPTAGFQSVGTVAANTTIFTDTTVATNTTYYYRVAAFNSSGGTSAPSNTASATTPIGPPAAPSNLTVVAVSPTQVDLSWTDNSHNEDGFRIERSFNAANGFIELARTRADVATYGDDTV
ncbi:fibronectin type III domain-containing protein [Planctomycetota bacterium]